MRIRFAFLFLISLSRLTHASEPVDALADLNAIAMKQVAIIVDIKKANEPIEKRNAEVMRLADILTELDLNYDVKHAEIKLRALSDLRVFQAEQKLADLREFENKIKELVGRNEENSKVRERAKEMQLVIDALRIKLRLGLVKLNPRGMHKGDKSAPTKTYDNDPILKSAINTSGSLAKLTEQVKISPNHQTLSCRQSDTQKKIDALTVKISQLKSEIADPMKDTQILVWENEKEDLVKHHDLIGECRNELTALESRIHAWQPNSPPDLKTIQDVHTGFGNLKTKYENVIK